MDNLLKLKRECHRRKTILLQGIGCREPNVRGLNAAAMQMSDWMYQLLQIRVEFDTLLLAHFKWLEDGLNLGDADFLKRDNVLSDTESSSSDDTVEDLFGVLEAEERLDKANAEYSPELAKLADLVQDSWATAAVEYLDLVLGNLFAHVELGKQEFGEEPHWREYISHVIKKGDFHLIEVTSLQEDHEMIPIRKLLEEEFGYVTEEDPQHPNPLTEILWWVNSENIKINHTAGEQNFDSTYFSGGYHCESTMLCLQLLARERENLNPNSMDSGIALPDKEVTDLFQEDILIMPSSRLCCPSCSHLFEFFYYQNRRRQRPIWGSDAHKDWVPCSLPPWVPRKAGEWMLAQASNSLKHRLEGIVEAMEASKVDAAAATAGWESYTATESGMND
ncbi:hypothetical protein CORC01_02000 [Colletotrichum orchidophilum]|uniref:Uncharacterized protein n=1 Tax=Colletotrichum orchidophilum TaxID=1209926 RepID=A0A1G4BMG5_9PEZI|nr:uncharacterized protein CORC01_02000 [Colletotrichum orchidophilum]OHF02604.1 hypothetical protein CORC01_02000 [Colletotrichum orchidophilum]